MFFLAQTLAISKNSCVNIANVLLCGIARKPHTHWMFHSSNCGGMAECEQSITCWPPDEQENAPDEQENAPDEQENAPQKDSPVCAETSFLDCVTLRSESPLEPCRSRLKHQSDVFMVDAALARWWRQEGRFLCAGDVNIQPGCSPHTVINLLARSKPGKLFMQGECRRLQTSLKTYPSSAKVHASLATFLEKCGDFDEAKIRLQCAIELQEESTERSEYKWLMERTARQIHIRQIQRENSLLLQERDSLTMPEPTSVERRDASSLSCEEFLHRYALTSTPVVITGLREQLTTTPWDLQHVRQIAGDCKLTLKKLDQSSVEWARLENAETTVVGEYIDGLHKQEMLSIHDKRYLFDWSIPINCPRLAEQLVIPKYFAGDFLQRTSAGSLYQHSWPSLFIAPSGLRSELHVDAFGSNFWMAMFQGSKRWLFFDKEDAALLYPQYPHSLDPVFDVDLTRPDLRQFPLLSLTRPKECIIQAGEVLFVPAGCPHTVTNLQQSLAISANFVDISNFDLVKRELEINALIDDRARDLLVQFKTETFDSHMDFNIQHTPV